MGRGSIKIITNRRLNLSDKEYEWYSELEQKYPNLHHFMCECMVFDDKGYITEFIPKENMPLEIFYFAMVISLNQRLRLVDDKLEALDKKDG